MAKLDETRPFLPVNIAVLTVSDTRTLETDTSGATLAERIAKSGHRVAERAIAKDEPDLIEAHLRRWIADPAVDVVITTGGTGITGRDVTKSASKASASCSACSATRRSAPPRSSPAPSAAWPGVPTCSPCPAAPAR
jgi:molybdenum cofactor synthesis domain-containing protein